ncbi:transcription termination factor MTEF1, chloroplastic-like [Aristolochia californica]|uniref:transcription termination factor MTEF1, chloroplastic-like n=1 Tax=Aristolochia californica TaxID=171875 RepID=UPI0035DCEF47
MFRYLSKTIVQTCRANLTADIRLLRCPALKSFCTITEPSDSEFCLLTYLKKSCGFSQQSALSVSKAIQNRKLKSPDSVIKFLKETGFSPSQITNIITKRPRFLFSRVEYSFAPKIKVLEEMGLSKPEILELIATDPLILAINLDKRIKPLVDFVRSVSSLNESVISTIKRYYPLFRSNLKKNVVPNVDLMRKYEIPDHRILEFLTTNPRALMVNTDRFEKNLKIVVGMGFRPSTHIFLEAVRGMLTLSKSTWKAKLEVYKSCGWSEQEIDMAFRRHPSTLMISEEKIRAGLDFLEKVLGLDRSSICANPIILLLSLEKRIIPRYKVLLALRSRGLVKKKVEVLRNFIMPKTRFYQKYVASYREEFPEILDVYQASANVWNNKLIES